MRSPIESEAVAIKSDRTRVRVCSLRAVLAVLTHSLPQPSLSFLFLIVHNSQAENVKVNLVFSSVCKANFWTVFDSDFGFLLFQIETDWIIQNLRIFIIFIISHIFELWDSKFEWENLDLITNYSKILKIFIIKFLFILGDYHEYVFVEIFLLWFSNP